MRTVPIRSKRPSSASSCVGIIQRGCCSYLGRATTRAREGEFAVTAKKFFGACLAQRLREHERFGAFSACCKKCSKKVPIGMKRPQICSSLHNFRKSFCTEIVLTNPRRRIRLDNEMKQEEAQTDTKGERFWDAS